MKCPGTGEIKINGEPISYFKYQQSREQVSHFLQHEHKFGNAGLCLI